MSSWRCFLNLEEDNISKQQQKQMTHKTASKKTIKLARSRNFCEIGNGAKPTLVLLHGAACSKHTWKDFMHATRHMYDVIALDLRGHGDSDLGEEEDFSASAMVEDVHQEEETRKEQQISDEM